MFVLPTLACLLHVFWLLPSPIIVKQNYLVPLRDGKDGKKPLLTKPMINTLFSSIEVIYNFNDRLRQDLDARIKQWSASQRLGDIFLRIVRTLKSFLHFFLSNWAVQMDFLKVYTSYIQTYDAALKLYEDLRTKNKLFVQMTDEIKLVVQGGYDLVRSSWSWLWIG